VYLEGLGFSGATTSPLNVVATGATFGDAVALSVTNGADVVIRGPELVGSQSAVGCSETTTTDSKVTVLDAKIVAGNEAANGVQAGKACRVFVTNSKINVNGGSALAAVNGGSLRGDRLHITGTKPAIVLLFSDVHMTILNSVIEDPLFQFSSIDSSSTTSSMYLGSNTILFRSQFNAIECNGLDQELAVRLENNIVVGMGTQANSVVNGNECDLTKNILHPQQNLTATNVDVDPLFVDVAQGDFRVQAVSPAVDAANPEPLALNDHDFIGAVRPQGDGPDIGAFEQ
jgi:hypothetical protein